MSATSEFDVKAKDWEANPAQSRLAQAVGDAILKEISSESRHTAFEYGCGTGLLSFVLRFRFDRIVPADSSGGMLEVLRSKIAASGITNMSVVHADLTQANPLTEKFDIIYTMMTLHHIPDTQRVLSELNFLLKPGGRLFIADLDAEDGSFHGEGFNGHKGFSREVLESRARETGLTDIRFQTVFQMPKRTSTGEEKRFPVFLMDCRKPEE